MIFKYGSHIGIMMKVVLVRSENVFSEHRIEKSETILNFRMNNAMDISYGYISKVIAVILFSNICISKVIMKIAKQIFRVGECVYAKMKFSPPWPALIVDIEGPFARVQFFGWQNQSYVSLFHL